MRLSYFYRYIGSGIAAFLLIKLRLSSLNKRRHRLAVVGGCTRLCEILRLKAAVRHIVAVEYLIVELLLHRECAERAAQELRSKGVRLLRELSIGCAPRRKPQGALSAMSSIVRASPTICFR